jgi:hypothetical protein
MLLLPMKSSIRLPKAIEAHRPQVEYSLRARLGPAHAGWLQAIFDEMATGAFDDARPHRPAARQVLVVAHVRPMPSVLPHRPPHRLPWQPRVRGVMSLGLQRCDDGVGLSRQQRIQIGVYPRQAMRMGLSQQGVGGVPQIRRGMDDIEHQGVLRQVRHHLLL